MAAADEDAKKAGLLDAGAAENPDMPPEGGSYPASKDVTHVWERRGSSWGLLLDVGFAAGGHIFLLMVILYGVWGEPRWQTPCPTREGNMFSTCLCEYTKAYILCFPEIALSALLLLVGRDLLQKRFYYQLLKVGGVMEFTATNPLKDPFMWALLTCYCHILVFLGLILAGSIEPPKLGGTGGKGADQLKQLKAGEESMGAGSTSLWADEEKLILVLELGGFIVIPGGLCVLFLFLAYDIEQSLVPMSRFVLSANHAEKEAEESGTILPTTLRTLKVLEDDDLAVLVQEKAEDLRAAPDVSGGNMYKEAIRLYYEKAKARGASPEASPTPRLLSGLWPGQVLVPTAGGVSAETSGLSGGGESGFRWLWRLFFGLAMWMFVVMLAFFVERAYRVGLRGWAGQVGMPDGPRLLVEAVHLVAVMLVLWRILTATFSCLYFPPVKAPVPVGIDLAAGLDALESGEPEKRVPGKGRRMRRCDYD